MSYAAAPVAPKVGPRLWVSIIVMVIGAAVGITGIGLFAGHAVHDISHVTHYDGTAPVEAPVDLTSGTWEVYVENGSPSHPTVLPSDVTVTSASGSTITVDAVSSSTTETLTASATDYIAEVKFKVPSDGKYDVAVDGPSGTRILVAKSLTDIVEHSAGWLALFGVGLLIGLIGLIMLIVGVVRRRRANRNAMAGGFGGAPAYVQAPPAAMPQAPAQASPAPGWYPDPSIPGTQRYWDGTKWTDQTQQGS